MGKIIHIQGRLQKLPPDNLITSGPWEFRRACWRTPFFTQMLRPLAEKLDPSGEPAASIPPHFTLNRGVACTIQAMYAIRRDEMRMRQTYYLVGLTDCMINQVNPVLRTDILRAMYKKVFAMKADFNIHWHGSLDQVLLPIDSRFYDDAAYRSTIRSAATLKALYRTIRDGTDEMFDILSLEYIFFCPWLGG
ncbi:MAG: hypothetical protein QG552_3006 [Thermodesulfobacteriota bacterium]|nr:hypothetical protein [Thermodesulfobacteriota bacterium]